MIEVNGARCPLSFDDVYRLCNKYHWFDCGDNDQYERLSDMIHDGASLDEVALAIWICSTEKDRMFIRAMLIADATRRGA